MHAEIYYLAIEIKIMKPLQQHKLEIHMQNETRKSDLDASRLSLL